MIDGFTGQIPYDRGIRLRIGIDTVLFLMLLGVIFVIRITNIRYNTLFVDEAIYATVGKNVLSGVFDQNATTWMYGSYFYPFLAAITNYLTGEAGLRGVSAILSTTAAVLVFLATARLFDKQSALWAMLIFGLTPISINVGQYAVYDVLVVPLLAVAAYCLIIAGAANSMKESAYLLLTAALSFTLATLTKYFAALYLPILVLIALASYLLRRRPIYPLFTQFLGPVFLLLGIYVFFYRYDLFILLSGKFGVQPGARWAIVQDVWAEIGPVTLLALVGAYLSLKSWRANLGPRPRWELILWALFILCLAFGLFAAPLYHLATANLHAAWKHTVYSLVFLSPLAGHGCAAVITRIRTYRGRWIIPYRVAGVAATMIGLIWFVNYGLDRNWGFQHSWPNVTNIVRYLRAQELNPNQRVLAEGGQIYEYYFDLDPTKRAMWHDTWYLEYTGRQGVEAMFAALQDRWFDFVVLDDYYTPGLRQQLQPALNEAGYTVGYEETQQLNSGDTILIQVYTLSK